MTFLRNTSIILPLVFIFIIPPGYSNTAGDNTATDEASLINGFFKKLYNFSFHAADSIVVSMKKTDMDRATIYNVEANLRWWKLLSGDSISKNMKLCDFCLDESIKLLSKRKKEDAEANLNLIYSWSLKARLENYNGNTLKALVCFYKSSIYIKKCIDRQYKDEKLRLVLGLYLYFVDYIESEYYVMNALLFSLPEGNKTKGLKYLEDCSSSADEMIRTETNYFLMKIYAYIEKDYPRAFEKVQILTQQHPANLVYDMEQLRLLLLLKNSNEAQLFKNRLIEEIRADNNISIIQKNHFFSQIGQLTMTDL